MPADYVTVHRTYDPLQADILGDLLRENGVAARVLGTRHGAVIGVGQVILQMHIEVPAEHAGEATDFVESFLRGDGLIEPDEAVSPADEHDDDVITRPEAGRSPLLAAGSVLLLFGGGHLYAQRYWTAAVLAVGQILAFSRLASQSWAVAASGAAMFSLVLLLDLAGSQVAVRRGPRRRHWRALSQLVHGAIYVAVAGTAASFIGPMIPAPELAERHYQVDSPAPAPLFVD